MASSSQKQSWSAKRDSILLIEKSSTETINAIKDYGRKHKKQYQVILLCEKKDYKEPSIKTSSQPDQIIFCRFDSEKSIREALHPFEDRLLAVTCRGEGNMAKFRTVIPHVPYLRTPTSESLLWSTDKLEMRRALRQYDPSISPLYTLVNGYEKKDLEKIAKKISFPVMIKPTGLAQSLLVSICFHEQELEKFLQKTFRSIKKAYREAKRIETPQVLVEEFMDGPMYSVDGYVSSRGQVLFCPLVYIKTGRTIGFDDFFGYQQMTPTTLSEKSTKDAHIVSKKAIKALSLRNTTVHIELIKSDEGWKIVEVGARIGGFRPALYELTYGIPHALNDVLNRIPRKLILPKKQKGFAAAMKFFAKKEGVLTSLKGIKKTEQLASFHSLKMNKQLGDRCKFAKNGGVSVFNITLFHKNRSELLADIRRLEQMIEIKTK